MTDREKIMYWLEVLQIIGDVKNIVIRPTSIRADARRFGFNEQGELESIKDGTSVDVRGQFRYKVRSQA